MPYGIYSGANGCQPILGDQQTRVFAKSVNRGIIQTISPRLDRPIATEHGFDAGG